MEPDEKKKKPLKTSEVSSLFDLKNEFLRKKNEAMRQGHTQYDDSYNAAGYSNKGVLTVKKEEKTRQIKESGERKRRIETLEEALRREEEAEAVAKAARIMKEKAEMYEKMQKGSVLMRDDGTPVEFLVDFTSKRRDEEPTTSEEPKEQPERLVERHIADEDRRVYGVSHVQFSLDEKKRAEEQKALLDLSRREAEQRERAKEERRKKAIDDLAKANLIRARLEREPTPEPEVDLTAIPLPIDPQKVERRPDTVAKEREWDKGKGSYHRWIEKQREERDDEFRPPDSYYR